MESRVHSPLAIFVLAILLMIASPVAAYVGSDVCGTCHQDQHSKWVESGHPYKLIKIFDEAPVNSFPDIAQYPNDPVDPPMGYTWSDISYTIGGYGWKMRWIDNNGYIVTGIENNQYNFETDTWTDYHIDDPAGTKPYDCGSCHTTGWVPSDDGNPDNNQDGLEGMWGTFFAGGVHCEQCHGEGDEHVNDPSSVMMDIDSSSQFCGQCHTRDAENHIASSGGFIKHHEQFDEWLHSPHATGPGCNTCHDPHASVKFDASAPGQGTSVSCENCHTEQAAYTAHNGFPDCVDCHMPKASKSAVAISDYQGDLRTHIWSINRNPVGKMEGMFTPDGTYVIEDGQGQAQITLDFACYSCHRDEAGVGGNYSMRTLEELSEFAFDMHGTLSDVRPDVVPSVVAINNAYPNPFNPQTKVSFTVESQQHITLSVYDMAGQQVAVLASDVFDAGSHTADWNGKNILGQDVASGTYLVNIRAKSASESLKIQLVR